MVVRRWHVDPITRDPNFDPSERAFYYGRVIETPTRRWTAYDAKRWGVTMSKDVPITIQERAHPSPVRDSPRS